MCRHVAVRLAEGEDVHEKATPEYVEKVLGPQTQRWRAGIRRTVRKTLTITLTIMRKVLT